MISAEFRVEKNRYISFVVSGHAMFASYGQDVVCASVSSAVQLTVNGVTEILKIAAHVDVGESEILMELPQGCDSEAANAFMCALCLQLQLLAEDYPKSLKLIISEV